MALSDNNPVLQWYADALTDLDEPTGTTPSNPGSLTDPTITGSPDAYADCSGSNGIMFTPATPVLEVGTGDVTIVCKARVDTFIAGDYLWENYDGSGTSQTACGFRIKITAGSSRRVGLVAPPGTESTYLLDCSSTTLTAGQDFIIAFRRSSGTWTVWLDADASGGMTSNTPNSNTLASAAFTECGGITFGSNGQGTTQPVDGRIYWLVAFDTAVSDADLQLAAWDTESNLKTAWLGGGGSSILRQMMAHHGG